MKAKKDLPLKQKISYEKVKHIFSDADKYEENEVLSYAFLTRSILGITSFQSLQDDEILISGLSKNMQTLEPLELTVITLRCGFDDGNIKTYAEIADMLGHTSERIRYTECKALRKMYTRLFDFKERSVNQIDEQESTRNGRVLSQETNVADLNLTVRTSCCLRNAGIKTLEQLIVIPNEKLLKINGIGKRQYVEIINFKQTYNFT